MPVKVPEEVLNGVAGYSLSLSGGGYRAMLFHAGALWRLNEAGILPQVRIISSVSGGSIAAGVLAKAWPHLDFDRTGVSPQAQFNTKVVTPLMKLAEVTIDRPSVLLGFLPGSSASKNIATRYGKHLFEETKLADLPDIPVFIFNATSLQTGEIWEFSKERLGGITTGYASAKTILLRDAVAASSAFPPILGPIEIDLESKGIRAEDWCDNSPGKRPPHGIDPTHVARQYVQKSDLEKIRKCVSLVDGGIRDNLGLVAIEELNRLRIDKGEKPLDQLVSDGGATYLPEAKPCTNWLCQGWRVINMALSEPDHLRLQSLVTRAYERDQGKGSRKLAQVDPDAAYWSIQRVPKIHQEYVRPESGAWPEREDIVEIASISTGLESLHLEVQKRLVNWGYLATHCSLPFLNSAWKGSERMKRILVDCRLPYPEAGISKRTAQRAICPSFRPELLKSMQSNMVSDPVSDPISPTTSLQRPPYLYDALEDAEQLLKYAAETGVAVDDYTRSAVLRAKDHGTVEGSEEATAGLLTALTKLAALLAPVTAESLKASCGDADKHAVHGYWKWAICLALVIVPFSFASFVLSRLGFLTPFAKTS